MSDEWLHIAAVAAAFSDGNDLSLTLHSGYTFRRRRHVDGHEQSLTSDLKTDHGVRRRVGRCYGEAVFEASIKL